MKKITFLFAFLALTTGANAQLYSEDFTNQEDKGQIFTTTDTAGVTWSIDTSDGALTADTDYFAVKNGMFTARDVDGLVTWQSPNINITGQTALNLAIDAGAKGDFEASGDAFKIEFVVDDTPEVVWEGVVDEDVAGDPFFIGESQLSTTLQNFSKVISSTGTTGYVKISCLTNAGTEYLYFDNIELTAGTLSTTTNTIEGLIVSSSNGTITTNKGEIVTVYNVLGQKVSNEYLTNGIYVVLVKEGSITASEKIYINN